MESRTNVIPRTFDLVCNVLQELGYLQGESLTEKGKLLTRIYAESDLLLSASN
jgi:ATP-dependent RNA helicase HelY